MAAANGFRGTITAGTGASYTVSIVGVGIVSATCLQIHSGETIPAGTPVILVKVGALYSFQVTVWM